MSGRFGGARLWLRRSTVILGLLISGAAIPSPDAQGASALREFDRAAGAANSHTRNALAYLRWGNRDLGAIEIEESREKWRLVGDAGAGVERLKRAIEEKNRDFLVNTLRELRPLERLLFLRFV